MLAMTMIGATTFGRTWRNMIRNGLFPTDSAASTYCRFRTLSTDPRTMRAVAGAMMIPIVSERMKKPFQLKPFDVRKMAVRKTARTNNHR